MFMMYEDDNFIIIYQDDLENLVNNFICYYNEHISLLLRKFHLENINKFEARLFSDKNLLGGYPYKLGDFAVFLVVKVLIVILILIVRRILVIL